MTHKEDSLTGFIGFRLSAWLKAQLMEEAMEIGETLSQYILGLIEAGWQEMNRENVKQSDERALNNDRGR